MKIANIYKQAKWEKFYKEERKLHIRPRAGIFASYDIFLCDSIISRHVPCFSGRTKQKPKITEIGSGDGKLLKKFSEMLNMEPIGIEYSKEAARIAQKNGIKTIIADVFDKKFLTKYKNYFDVVLSYGFLEHILPAEKAAKIHYKLLKPGGYVIIQIPRFKGFNLIKAKFLRPELIPFHNLKVMNEDKLEKACFDPSIKKLFCKNYGTFKLRFPIKKKNFKYYLLKTVGYSEYLLNPLFRILFKDRGFETALFSPAVMFIGRKILKKGSR
jgi:SAM-dependent methyltransferase